jgi:hypothetical protein
MAMCMEEATRFILTGGVTRNAIMDVTAPAMPIPQADRYPLD